MSSGRKRRGTSWAESWGDGAYSLVHCIAPPVDLHAIARRQRIKGIKLRLMVQLGALVPVCGGFEIFIRHRESRDLDVECPEPPKLLSAQQRFTLAHEIAHTLFYKGFDSVPIANAKLKRHGTRKEFGLEEVCNRVAKRLLVPKALLAGEIDRRLENPEKIDADFVRAMAARFRVSNDVVLGRLRAVAPDNAFARCLLLVRKTDGEDRVSNWYMGMSLLSAFPPLKRQREQPLLKWLPDLPASILDTAEGGEWQVKRHKRVFLVQKFPTGKSGSFLMQIDDLARKAPSSRRSRKDEGPYIWTALE